MNGGTAIIEQEAIAAEVDTVRQRHPAPHLPTLGDPIPEVDPALAADRAIDLVRQRLHRTGQEVAAAQEQIAADARWSDQHKREQIEAIRQGAAAEAEAMAAAAWTRVELAEARLTENLRDAERRVDADVNPVAVRALAEDYRSQLDLLGDDRMSRLRAVEAMLDQAEASGDTTRLRAVRVAVGPMLAEGRSTGAGIDDQLSRDLLRRARGLLTIERQEADRIAADLRRLKSKRPELRFEIERLETEATGRRPDAFSPTPWQRRIMGITPESMGGGVMTAEQAAAWDAAVGRK